MYPGMYVCMHSYAKTGLLAIVFVLWLGYVESLVTVRRLSVAALGGRRGLESGLAHLALQGVTLSYSVPPIVAEKLANTLFLLGVLEAPL